MNFYITYVNSNFQTGTASSTDDGARYIVYNNCRWTYSYAAGGFYNSTTSRDAGEHITMHNTNSALYEADIPAGYGQYSSTNDSGIVFYGDVGTLSIDGYTSSSMSTAYGYSTRLAGSASANATWNGTLVTRDPSLGDLYVYNDTNTTFTVSFTADRVFTVREHFLSLYDDTTSTVISCELSSFASTNSTYSYRVSRTTSSTFRYAGSISNDFYTSTIDDGCIYIYSSTIASTGYAYVVTRSITVGSTTSESHSYNWSGGDVFAGYDRVTKYGITSTLPQVSYSMVSVLSDLNIVGFTKLSYLSFCYASNYMFILASSMPSGLNRTYLTVTDTWKYSGLIQTHLLLDTASIYTSSDEREYQTGLYFPQVNLAVKTTVYYESSSNISREYDWNPEIDTDNLTITSTYYTYSASNVLSSETASGLTNAAYTSSSSTSTYAGDALSGSTSITAHIYTYYSGSIIDNTETLSLVTLVPYSYSSTYIFTISSSQESSTLDKTYSTSSSNVGIYVTTLGTSSYSYDNGITISKYSNTTTEIYYGSTSSSYLAVTNRLSATETATTNTTFTFDDYTTSTTVNANTRTYSTIATDSTYFSSSWLLNTSTQSLPATSMMTTSSVSILQTSNISDTVYVSTNMIFRVTYSNFISVSRSFTTYESSSSILSMHIDKISVSTVTANDYVGYFTTNSGLTALGDNLLSTWVNKVILESSTQYQYSSYTTGASTILVTDKVDFKYSSFLTDTIGYTTLVSALNKSLNTSESRLISGITTSSVLSTSIRSSVSVETTYSSISLKSSTYSTILYYLNSSLNSTVNDISSFSTVSYITSSGYITSIGETARLSEITSHDERVETASTAITSYSSFYDNVSSVRVYDNGDYYIISSYTTVLSTSFSQQVDLHTFSNSNSNSNSNSTETVYSSSNGRFISSVTSLVSSLSEQQNDTVLFNSTIATVSESFSGTTYTSITYYESNYYTETSFTLSNDYYSYSYIESISSIITNKSSTINVETSTYASASTGLKQISYTTSYTPVYEDVDGVYVTA